MTREIRLITPEYIEDYLTIYLNAYPAYKNTGNEGRDKYRPRFLRSMAEDRNIHFYGLFEDGKLIAQMKLIDFKMNAFGKMQKAAGLMALGVHPMHKKKGAARDMVKFFEEYTEKSGAIVSMLLPFRMDFYRKMGYGYGSKMEEYLLPTVNLPVSHAEQRSHIRFIGSGEKETEMLLECYSRFAAQYHGMVQKFEDELGDYADDSETKRVGYYDGDQLQGYVTYDIVSMSDTNYTKNRINVKELVYLNGTALQGLLGYLQMQSDLADTIVLRTGEPDFYHILPSAQNISGHYTDFGFLETNTASVGTMYKICNPEAFIKATDYRRFIPSDVKIKFIYENEFRHTTEETGIVFTTEGKWMPADKDTVFDLTAECSLSDLSALLMGSAEFSSLVRLGAVKLSDSGYTSVLDLLFHVEQKPWTNTDY